MSDFEIIRGYGVPPRLSKYPFNDLDVGDAFIVNKAGYDRVRTLASRINRAGEKKLTVRKRDDNTYVVVRVA